MSHDEQMQLQKAAEIVTKARDLAGRARYKGEIIDSHAPEMPTRFTKQLTQVVRGGTAIGLNHEQAMQLAIRCAKDFDPAIAAEDPAQYCRQSTLASLPCLGSIR